MREQATKNIASGMTRQAALTAAREATETELKRAAGKTLGGMAGIFGAAYARGVGEIAQNAQQAGLDPAGLKGLEVLSGAGLYAAMEGMSDKLLLGALKGTAGGLVKRTLKRGAGTALAEGATEVGQDTVTGIAAGVGAPDGLELFNAFAAGAVGGGVVGGAGAALRPASDTTPAPTVDPNATPEPTDEELAAMPADTSTVAAGTTLDLGNNAVLVMGADGRWGYAPGSTPNADADTIIGSATSAPVAIPGDVGPTEPVAGADSGLPDTIDFEPLEEGSASSAPTVELTPDGDVALTDPPVEIPGLTEPTRPSPLPAHVRPATEEQITAVPRNEIDAQESALAQLIDRSENNFESQGFDALRRVASIVQNMPTAKREAILRAYPQGLLAYAIEGLGITPAAGSLPQSTPWVQAIRTARDGGEVLDVLAQGPSNSLTTLVASGLKQVYEASGIPFPRVRWYANAPEVATPNGPVSTYSGLYNPGTHAVGFVPRTNTGTIVHELLHGLTTKGLDRIRRKARAGDRQATDVLRLIQSLHQDLVRRAGRRNMYGNQRIDEMFAELLEPEFLALAATTQLASLDDASMRGLLAINNSVTANDTLLDAIAAVVSYVLRALSGANTIPPGSVLQVLQRTAAYAAVQSREQIAADGTASPLAPSAAPTPAAPTGAQPVEPGVPLPTGTIVAETPRNEALLPTGAFVAMVQSLNPDSALGSPEAHNWYYQPGAIINEGPGQLFVVNEHNYERGELRVQPVSVDGQVTGGVRSIPARLLAGRFLRSLPARASSTPVVEPANAGTRVTPGQALSNGTLVKETPRDQSLMPPSQNVEAMRTGSRNASVTLEQNRRWYFQPGVIVPSYGGTRDVVIEYLPGPDGYNWNVRVQSIARDGRVNGPVRTHSTAPTYGEVADTLGGSVAQTPTQPPASPAQRVPDARNSLPAPNANEIDMTGRTATNPISALLGYAKRRATQRTLRRGVQRMRGFGQLVPETTTADERLAAFARQFRAGLRAVGASLRMSGNGRSFTVTMADGQTATGDLYPRGDTFTVSVGTTGLRYGSSTGGQFYDILNGAAVASRVQMFNNGYTGANEARMPINRLRAILKWGALTGDFANAALMLSLNHGNGWSAQQALSAAIEAVRVRVDRVYPNASLSDDGRSINYGNGQSILVTQPAGASTARSRHGRADCRFP